MAKTKGLFFLCCVACVTSPQFISVSAAVGKLLSHTISNKSLQWPYYRCQPSWFANLRQFSTFALSHWMYTVLPTSLDVSARKANVMHAYAYCYDSRWKGNKVKGICSLIQSIRTYFAYNFIQYNRHTHTHTISSKWIRRFYDDLKRLELSLCGSFSCILFNEWNSCNS